MLFDLFDRKPLELDVNKPFKIKITKMFFSLRVFIWPFFVLFWILLIGGIIATISVTLKERSSVFFIPIFSTFWAIGLWLFFYVWCWICLGSNYPEMVEVNEDGAKIKYTIQLFNKDIPKDLLILKEQYFLGVPMLYIKNKKKLIGIKLNKLMYHIYK